MTINASRPTPCDSGGRGARSREAARAARAGPAAREHGRDDQVRTNATPPAARPAVDSGGGEEPDAPEPVERRHDRPARGALDPHGLFVDGDVHQPRRDPERDERDRESREPACEPGPCEADGEQRKADLHNPAATEPVDEPGGDARAEEQPGREGGQRDAELAVAEPQVRLDRRDPRGERPRDCRMDEEDGGGASTRAHGSGRPGAARCGRLARAARRASRPG